MDRFNFPRIAPKHTLGFVMISSLIMLILLTIVGLSISRSFVLQETISGNHSDKIRAFELAQSTLNYAEWWLLQSGNASTGSACNAVVTSPTICNQQIANPTTLPWSTGVTYKPTNITISNTGGSSTSYYDYPMFYIAYIGNSFDTGKSMYAVTAYAYGGSANTVAVVQSIVEFQ
jgi:type IV pilus assembly protein PilX